MKRFAMGIKLIYYIDLAAINAKRKKGCNFYLEVTPLNALFSRCAPISFNTV